MITFVQIRQRRIASLFFPCVIPFLLFLLAGCNSRLDRMQYIKWVRDYGNNLHVQSSVADYVFDLQYQPAEYVLLQRGIKNATNTELVEELKRLSDMQYYTLNISTRNEIDLVSYGSDDLVEKQQKQYYLSYQFQNDITIEEDGKVLPCVLYHFERPRGTEGGRTIVLGFKNSNKNSAEARIVIRSEWFNALPIKIKVSKSNIPQVAL